MMFRHVLSSGELELAGRLSQQGEYITRDLEDLLNEHIGNCTIGNQVGLGEAYIIATEKAKIKPTEKELLNLELFSAVSDGLMWGRPRDMISEIYVYALENNLQNMTGYIETILEEFEGCRFVKESVDLNFEQVQEQILNEVADVILHMEEAIESVLRKTRAALENGLLRKS